jgi:hypothetical protein
MPGARCARSLVCKKTNTRVSHHGHTGTTRHSPRNGFTAYFALFPVTRLALTPSPALLLADLTPAWGVRTTRLGRTWQAALVSRAAASTASRPAFVTIASRPSEGRDQIDIVTDLPPPSSEI